LRLHTHTHTHTHAHTYSIHCLVSETEGSGMLEKEVNAFSAALP